MRWSQGLLQAMLLLASDAFSAPTAPSTETSISSRPAGSVTYRNAAYFANWDRYYRKFNVEDIPVSQLTEIIYAFANVHTNGTVYLTDESADKENFPKLFELKKANRQLKTLFSIGGWKYTHEEHNISEAAKTPAGIETMARTAVQAMVDGGFDGIDIDWEYPSDTHQAAEYLTTLKEIRRELDQYATEHALKYRFLLTVAVPAGPTQYTALLPLLPELVRVIDTFYLMTYDFQGGFSKHAGHQANHLPSIANQKSTDFSAVQAIDYYINNGVPAGKISYGLPLYGRSFQQTDGLGKPFQGVGGENFGAGSYEGGVWDYKVLPKAGGSVRFDPETKASYTYDPVSRELVSFTNVKEAKVKAAYIKEKGLAGSFFWEISSDKKGEESLVTTLRNELGRLDKSENCLDCYASSQYQNIKNGGAGQQITTKSSTKDRMAPTTKSVIYKPEPFANAIANEIVPDLSITNTQNANVSSSTWNLTNSSIPAWPFTAPCNVTFVNITPPLNRTHSRLNSTCISSAVPLIFNSTCNCTLSSTSNSTLITNSQKSKENSTFPATTTSFDQLAEHQGPWPTSSLKVGHSRKRSAAHKTSLDNVLLYSGVVVLCWFFDTYF